MNLWTGSTAEMWSELRDPGLFDTVLTARGLRQARQLADQVRTLDSIPEVIISSPLTRALQTTDVGFRSVHPNVPVEVPASCGACSGNVLKVLCAVCHATAPPWACVTPRFFYFSLRTAHWGGFDVFGRSPSSPFPLPFEVMCL